MSDLVLEPPDLRGEPERRTEASPSQASDDLESEQHNLDARRRSMEELDSILCRTLLRIIRSGRATPSHLNVARQYLKDKGYTLPELEKRERITVDRELLGDLDLPFGNA